MFTLDANLTDWTQTNLRNGCSLESMAQSLQLALSVPYDQAFAAVSQVKVSQAAEVKSMPCVDTSSNQIVTSDRTIQVLLALKNPDIVLLGNVLSDEECDALIEQAQDRFTRSAVVDPATGNFIVSPHRTSDGAMFQRGETDLHLTIEKRLAELTQWPVENGEGMQLQRYGTGNEYRPHFDWFDLTQEGYKKATASGGQRLATLVLYLSDVDAGGGTIFPELGLNVHPRKGSAVFFSNINAAGEPDRRVLHGGAPVIAGMKTIANKWLRESRFG